MIEPKVKPVNVCPDDLYAQQLAAYTITVYCCREWEVAPLMSWGRCGICKQRPERKSG